VHRTSRPELELVLFSIAVVRSGAVDAFENAF